MSANSCAVSIITVCRGVQRLKPAYTDYVLLIQQPTISMVPCLQTGTYTNVTLSFDPNGNVAD